jgi:hypothetical protein
VSAKGTIFGLKSRPGTAISQLSGNPSPVFRWKFLAARGLAAPKI